MGDFRLPQELVGDFGLPQELGGDFRPPQELSGDFLLAQNFGPLLFHLHLELAAIFEQAWFERSWESRVL